MERTAAVHTPTTTLSTREHEVLSLVALGLTNREIGSRLYLSQHTVKDYLSTAMMKLGVRNRAAAAVALATLAGTGPFGG